MSVLAVTIFISMALVLFFVGGFLYHHDFSGGDALRDSLLPFRSEERPAQSAAGDGTNPSSGTPASTTPTDPLKQP
jgi:hypothetical protein